MLDNIDLDVKLEAPEVMGCGWHTFAVCTETCPSSDQGRGRSRCVASGRRCVGHV